MARRPIRAEDLWALPRVGAPAPAPDGRFAVVPVTTYSLEANQGTTRLWLVPADGGAPRPLTAADVSSTQPAVSPDGRRLAFRRKPGGTPGDRPGGPKHADQEQLYLLSLDGGEAERLTDLPLGAGDPRWFPDGRRLALISPVFVDAPTIAGTAERAAERAADPVKAMTTEDRVYRYWDRWVADGTAYHIFALDLDTLELTDLTPANARWLELMDPTDQYRIAPDGRELAFAASRSEPPHDPIVWGVYTVALPARLGAGAKVGRPRLVDARHKGHASRPVYSPDGRWLVYGIQKEIDFYADPERLVALDRKTGRSTVLTAAWDGSAAGWTFGDDAAQLVFAAEVGGRNALFGLDVAAAAADPEANGPRELARGGWFGAPRVAGGRIFTTEEALVRPPEVVSFATDGADRRQHTDFAGPALAGLQLGAVDEVTFEGHGGRPVQMFLVYPPGVRPAKGKRRDGARLPLVHMIHGGPHGAFGDQWHWRWNPHLFAAPGYLAALVNFHGSTGWGEAFTASILGRWGDQPYDDVMAATDWLVERGLVDPDRMAATGGSYGGYLVSWIAGHTDRFRCLVNHAGVADFQVQQATDITQGRRRSMGGEPWDDLEGLDRYNPVRHARGFRSPMLVLHGERDYRVPYAHGLAIYNIYKAMGLPARLVLYPDENHWILKPRNSLHWYGEVLGWLGRWLGSA